MCDWICAVIYYFQDLLLKSWNWFDAQKVIAILAGLFAIKEAWFRCWHKFSILPIPYISASSEYVSEAVIFNLKNKKEIICAVYAKLKTGEIISLDIDKTKQPSERIISPNNPIIMGEYQSQKVYIRRASYFKQRVAQKDAPLFNYIDIQNKICGYYIVLSNGKILKAKDLKVYKDIFEFENGHTIIDRQVCCGTVKLKNKIISRFRLYNQFGRIVAIFSDGSYVDMEKEKVYSEDGIKKSISKQAKLSKACIIELDSNIKNLLQTLKQKEFPEK